MDSQIPDQWLVEMQKFLKEIKEAWELDPDGELFWKMAADSLDRYAQARLELLRDGLTFKTDAGLIRRHPACEIVKAERAGFLSAMRALDLEGDENKGKVGNPGSYKLWQKRGKV